MVFLECYNYKKIIVGSALRFGYQLIEFNIFNMHPCKQDNNSAMLFCISNSSIH